VRTIILGMGNTILCDDGIGIIITRYLEKHLSGKITCVDFSETTWGGFRILDLLSGYDKAIIIDSIKTGNSPAGTIHKLTPDDLLHTLRLNSYHDINFFTAIKLGEEMGIKMPAIIDIYAVEVNDNITITENLNEEIRKSIKKCSTEVINNLTISGLLKTPFDLQLLEEIDSNEKLEHYYYEIKNETQEI
jgi:hydrogenase maturation protease